VYARCFCCELRQSLSIIRRTSTWTKDTTLLQATAQRTEPQRSSVPRAADRPFTRAREERKAAYLNTAALLREVVRERDAEANRALRLLKHDRRLLSSTGKRTLARLAWDRIHLLNLARGWTRTAYDRHAGFPMPAANHLISSEFIKDAEICKFLFHGCFSDTADALTAAYLCVRVVENPVYESTLFSALEAGGIDLSTITREDLRDTLKSCGHFLVLSANLPSTRRCLICDGRMSLSKSAESHFYVCDVTSQCRAEAIAVESSYSYRQLESRSAARQNNAMYYQWLHRRSLTLAFKLPETDRIKALLQSQDEPSHLYETDHKPNFKIRSCIHHQASPEQLKQFVVAGLERKEIARRCKIGRTRLTNLIMREPAMRDAYVHGVAERRERRKALRKRVPGKLTRAQAVR